MIRMTVAAMVLLLLEGGALLAQAVPTGTRFPIRFLDPVVSGKDLPGTVVRAQTLAPIVVGGCEVIPAFVSLAGTIELSHAGRTAYQRGKLRIMFDSIALVPGGWVRLSGVLDSLEWSRRVSDGTVSSGRRSYAALALEPLTFAAIGLGVAPAASIEAARLVHRPSVSILAGQEAVVRLVDSLRFAEAETCRTAPLLRRDIDLPPLEAHATTRNGTGSGDPINFVIVGGDSDLVRRAFASANWALALSPNLGHIVVGAVDAVLGRGDPRAPMSKSYFDGRMEDLGFERASSSARVRHHLRLWKMVFPSSRDTLWAGAASEDVGLSLKPTRVPTHRIDAYVDRERELLIRELLAGGCLDLQGYTRLPGAVERGVNSRGQPYQTDGLTAVLKLKSCPFPS